MINTPTNEARLVTPIAITGFMGVGKTRLCEELAEDIIESTKNENILFLTVRVDQLFMHLRDSIGFNLEQLDKLHSQNSESNKEGEEDQKPKYVPTTNQIEVSHFLLCHSLLYANLGPKGVYFKDLDFHDILSKIIDQGYTKVILFFDEIQFHPMLIRYLLIACENTMIGPNFDRCQILPILAGIVSPGFDALPSRSGVKEFCLEPLESNNPILIENFCSALPVHVSTEDFTQNKDFYHLNHLFKLCGGRPNILNSMIKILERWKPWTSLSFDDQVASDIFDEMVEDLAGTYTVSRWHVSFGGLREQSMHDFKSEEYKDDYIMTRNSFQKRTKLVMKRILLDVILNNVIDPQQPVLKNSECQIPTYEECKNNGIVYLVPINPHDDDDKSSRVDIPIFGLMQMEKIVKISPPKFNLLHPFSLDWEKFEVLGITSIYWKIKYFQSIPLTKIKLQDLRPGAQWSPSCADVTIDLTSQELDFKVLGTQIVKRTKVLHSGTDGLGKEVELKPGLIALTMPNQKAWDGFAFFKGWVKDKPVYIVFANQSKFLRQNVGDGVISRAILGNAAIKQFHQGMKKIGEYFENLVLGDLDMMEEREIIIVYDVFSSKNEPIDPNLKSSYPYYCVTRGSDLKAVVGPCLYLLLGFRTE